MIKAKSDNNGELNEVIAKLENFEKIEKNQEEE